MRSQIKISDKHFASGKISNRELMASGDCGYDFYIAYGLPCRHQFLHDILLEGVDKSVEGNENSLNESTTMLVLNDAGWQRHGDAVKERDYDVYLLPRELEHDGLREEQ